MYSNYVLHALRVKLLEKIGSTQLAPGDCTKISIEIFLNTGHYVSKSTIMRIFGISTDLSDSSDFVKNTISIFLGFKDWDTLQQMIVKDK